MSATVVPESASPRVLAEPRTRAHRRWTALELVPAACAAVALLAYVLTISSGVGWDDQAELAAGIDNLGSVHATGYPLYLLLGKAFEILLPFASASLSASLFSAVTAAVAVGLVSRLVAVQTGSWLGAAVAALPLAGGAVMWANAVTASVYTLFLVTVLALLFAIRRWDARPDARSLAWVSLAAGAAVVSHRSGLVFAGAAAVYVLVSARRMGVLSELLGRLPRTAAAALACLLPLATLSYVWIRTGAGVWPDSPTLFGMTPWETINGGPQRLAPEAKLLGATASEMVTHAKSLVVLAPTQLSLAAVVLVPAGLWARRGDAGFLAVGLLPALITSALVITTPMSFVYWHLPLMAMGAVLAGAGIAWLADRPPSTARTALIAVALLALVTGPAYGYRYVDRHRDDASGWARTVLNRLPRNATIVAPWAAYAPLKAEQELEGVRRDVDVRYSPRLIDSSAAVNAQRGKYVVSVAVGAVTPAADRHAAVLVAPVDVDVKGIQDMNVGSFGITAPMPQAEVFALDGAQR